MLEMLWTSNGLHLIFIYIPIKVQMFFILWKPMCHLWYLNIMPLLPQQSLMWRCHLWYLLPLLLHYLSCGNVICGTSYLCSLSCFSCGNVICGTSVVCLVTCTIVGTAHTTINIVDGSTLPLIIFYALTSMLSCSLFTPELEVPPSPT